MQIVEVDRAVPAGAARVTAMTHGCQIVSVRKAEKK
jgi:hypothetical protein